MKPHAAFVWIGLASGCALGILSGFMLGGETTAVRITMVLSVTAAVLNLLAIPFFLNGLKYFKSGLKQACITLCIGIGLFGLAQVQLPLISLFEWGFWINSGGLAIPYLLGVIGIFLGIRLFARLLSIKSLLSSSLLALFVTIIVSVGVAALPHVKVATDELSYDIALALSIWNSVFITFAAILAFRIRQNIGPAYTHSMTWLFRALVIISFAGWHYTVVQLTMTTGHWYYDYSLTILPFVAGAFVLVLAGRSFNSINMPVETDEVTPVRSRKVQKAAPDAWLELDIVLYLASLVSNPTEVDVILDDVRLVTAHSQPGQALPEKDKQILARVYTQLENYLLHKDALRVFTLKDLRQGIAKKFVLNDQVRMLLWHEK